MTWVVIASTDTDPDSPVTTNLAGAWSTNLASAFAGELGAPILQAAALATDAAMDAWVQARYTQPAVGAIGSTAFLLTALTTGYIPGATETGANLRYSAVYGNPALYSSYAAAPGGTWECRGYVPPGSTGATLWERTS